MRSGSTVNCYGLRGQWKGHAVWLRAMGGLDGAARSASENRILPHSSLVLVLPATSFPIGNAPIFAADLR